MPTQEITAQNWLPFFDAFSKHHPDTAATIQVISPELGAQEMSNPMPLVGISVDDEGSEKGSIVVMLGSDPEAHLTHLIEHPTHVWLKTDGIPSSDAIEIEDADDTKTILQLHPIPALPD